MSAATPKESQPDVGVVPPGDAVVTDSEEEELYKRACAALAEHEAPTQKRGTGLALLATFVLFAAAAAWSIGFDLFGLRWWFVPSLIGVLLLHEAGHYLGMRLFGFRDLRIFFIPFFGAVVSGQKHAAPPWQRAIVLLLGPLPGIGLAVLLLVLHPPWLTVPVAYFLLVINGLNLLPLYPLDGGQLVHVLIASGRPLLESAFLLLSAVALAVLAWLNGWWVLGVLAFAVLIRIPFLYRGRQRRVPVLQELPELPAKLGELSEVQRRALFRSARRLHPESVDPTECASEMQTLHEEAVRKPAGIITGLGLVILHVAGAIVVLWSLSSFFSWGEAEYPGEWSTRRVETFLKAKLKLDEISLREVAPGTQIGTGQTAEGAKMSLTTIQDKEKKSLTWSAVSEDGKKKRGRLGMTNGAWYDVTLPD